MEALQINPYTFFGVLEVVLMLLVASGFLLLRSKRLARRVRALEAAASKRAGKEAAGYAQYLRDEIIRNQDMIDAAAASDDETEKQLAERLALRKRFLEIELEARELEANPVRFRQMLASSLAGLLGEPGPAADAVAAEAEQQEEASAGEPAVEEEVAEQERERKTVDTHDQEFNRLKDIINNQQDAMNALRAELEARQGEIQDMDKLNAILDRYEKQSKEMENCIQMLEQENERLKAMMSSNGPSGGAGVEEVSSGVGTLKSMVDSQQATISSLRELIAELAPEAGKARELEDALEGIQRANRELNGCISVLEDENALLRSELEQIRTQLEQAAVDTAEADIASPEETPAEADGEKRELEIKVQELEALVEFKDAAIEELEKQYNALEAKYLEATGQKKVE